MITLQLSCIIANVHHSLSLSPLNARFDFILGEKFSRNLNEQWCGLLNLVIRKILFFASTGIACRFGLINRLYLSFNTTGICLISLFNFLFFSSFFFHVVSSNVCSIQIWLVPDFWVERINDKRPYLLTAHIQMSQK